MATPINPGEIPYVTPQGGCPPADPDALAASAAIIAAAAGTVRDNGQDAVVAWSAITSCYKGPGDTQIHEALLPVGPQTDALASGLEQVAAALTDFSDEIRPITAELANLKTQAEQLTFDISNFTPYVSHDPHLWAYLAGLPIGAAEQLIGVQIETWDQDQTLIDCNNNLISQINTQTAAYETAERDCANQINAIYQGTQYHPYAADGSNPDDPAAYGYDEIPVEAPLPWGSAVDRQESCQEKTVMFIPGMYKGIVTGAGEMLAGIASLDGYSFDSSGVHRSWGTAIQAWDGLSNLASAAMAPLLPHYDFTTSKWVTPVDNISMLANVVTGLVGVHVNITLHGASVDASAWEKDPGTALGGAVFNIGSFFIPIGAGAHGAAAGAETAADVAKAGEVAGDLGKGAEIAENVAKTSNTIKLADLADDLAKDINIKIPEIDTVLPESLTRPHIPEPRPDIPGAKPDIPETRPDIPETRPETPEPVHDTPPENPAPEPGRGAEPAPEPAQEPKPIDTSGDPTGPHSDPVKHDKTNDADEPTTPAEDHTPATETHPDQADHPASETHSHTGDAADGDGSGPAHPAPRLPDVHDYGTDLSQVSHHETQLADISRGIPHSEEFTAVESTRNSLADTSHELTEQAKPILQDLHENHGINWTTRQMSRSDFDEVMNKATDQALKAGDTALARKIDSLYDIWFDQLDTKTALTHASEELGSVGGDDVLAHYGVTRGGGGVGAGKGSFDKFGVSGDGSQLFVLEEKGGGATVNSAGRVVEDGTRAPQGSAAYFTDIAKHDTVFQEFLSRPENASLAQGLKDGTVEARYLLAKSAGDGTTVLSEFLMNPDSIDWNQILGG